MLFVTICLLLQLHHAVAFYQGTDVITLTSSNFESKIKSGGVWVVEVRKDQSCWSLGCFLSDFCCDRAS